MGEFAGTMEVDRFIEDAERLAFEAIIAQEFPTLTEVHLNLLADAEIKARGGEDDAEEALKNGEDPQKVFDALLEETPEQDPPLTSKFKIDGVDTGTDGSCHYGPWEK